MDTTIIEKFGVLAAIAVAMFLQNKAYQDSMRKQVDEQTTSAAKQLKELGDLAIKREDRMAARIDTLENEVRDKLEEIITTQQQVLGDSTQALKENSQTIRENSAVMASLKTMLPKTA